MKWIKFLIKSSAAILLIFWAGRFCRQKTDGFTLLKIESHLSFNPRWEVAPDKCTDVHALLSQKYHYLSKGAQCYVFLSEDKQNVLKFFRQNLFYIPKIYHHLPLTASLKNYRTKKLQKKKNALEKDFQSYVIAYEDLKEETGLVFMHLNKTKMFQNPLILVDKLGIEHRIDPNQYEFYLQKRADLIPHKLETCKTQKEAKAAICALFDLLEKKMEKKICDTDENLKKNFGFIKEEAIQIDIGRFSKDHFSEKKALKSLTKKKEDLQYWINDHYPELSSFFEQEFNRFKQKHDS